jgi:hypothetical protein
VGPIDFSLIGTLTFTAQKLFLQNDYICTYTHTYMHTYILVGLLLTIVKKNKYTLLNMSVFYFNHKKVQHLHSRE